MAHPYRNWIRNALLLLAVGGVVYVLLEDRLNRAAATPAAAVYSQAPHLAVYYFDQGKDCETCVQIPAYTQAVLQRRFERELATGRISWHAIDTDDPAKEHYLNDYQLYAKSIVLSLQKDGAQLKWKNLDRVWELVYDRVAFERYVEEEMAAALEALGP